MQDTIICSCKNLSNFVFMDDVSKLIWVKSIHTLVWIFFNVVFFYLFCSAWTKQINHWFWIGIGLIAVECIVLLFNGWECPLTPIARRYSDSTKDNFDIYLPNLLARHNKTIYSILFVILVLIYLFK